MRFWYLWRGDYHFSHLFGRCVDEDGCLECGTEPGHYWGSIAIRLRRGALRQVQLTSFWALGEAEGGSGTDTNALNLMQSFFRTMSYTQELKTKARLSDSALRYTTH